MLCLLFFAAACFSFVHGYLQVKAPNQWTTLPVMPTARDGALALATATEIFVIGGSISPLHFTNNPVATVERFSLASKTWLPLPPLSVPRYYATGQVFSQGSEYRLIVIGGSSTNDTNIASVEVFDPLLNSWFPRTPMPTNRCCMASVLVSNEIYVLGGLLSDYGVNTIEVYDIVKGICSIYLNHRFLGGTFIDARSALLFRSCFRCKQHLCLRWSQCPWHVGPFTKEI
eukprot:TRINITY_DN4143_c0_g1_i2.p2 TRINITY_DN4143_c0_g1~~TRINITY_DN4143_c0_g1_i2.p2  ORF type:complete len:236 (+),score=16.12 TRINITY_DN4143_c0_g1_i2:22-708(+)